MPDLQSCRACDTMLPRNASECPQCGEAVAPPKHMSRRARRAADPEAVERSRQRQEFGRIKNIVFTVRNVYRAGIVFAVAYLMLFHLVLAPILVELDMWGYVIVRGAWLWGLMALMVVGTLKVVKAPFVWTVAGAGYWTLSVGLIAYDVLGSAEGPGPVMITALALMSFMMLAFWFAAMQSRRVVELMRQNPELQLQRERIDPDRVRAGGVADTASRRIAEARAREGRSLGWIGVVVALAVMLVGVGVWAMTRPPAVDGAVAAFESAWRGRDVETLRELFADGPQSRDAERFVDGVVQRGWTAKMPELGEPRVDARDASATVRYDVTDGEVALFLKRNEQRWAIEGSRLPPLEVGPVADAVQLFRDAWHADGTSRLMALMRPETRRKIGARIEKLLADRDWTDARPELGEHDVRSTRDRVQVLFALGFGEVEALFEWWHPTWRLVGFAPPR